MSEKTHMALLDQKAVSGAKTDFRKRKSEFDHYKRAESVYDVPTNISDKLFVKIFICETAMV
jgi:hypothetical protein